jgi:hypothetical protein
MTLENGHNSPTVKEYLARIDGKLDQLAGRIASLEIKVALTEQQVANNRKEIDEQEGRVGKLEGRFSSVLSGIGVGLFAGAVYLFRDLTGGP